MTGYILKSHFRAPLNQILLMNCKITYPKLILTTKPLILKSYLYILMSCARHSPYSNYIFRAHNSSRSMNNCKRHTHGLQKKGSSYLNPAAKQILAPPLYFHLILKKKKRVFFAGGGILFGGLRYSPPIKFAGPIRSFTAKENHIGLAASKILRYIQKKAYYFT